MGGETSFRPIELVQAGLGVVGLNSTAELIPKAGHWIAGENPEWVAERLLRFFGMNKGVPSVDLS
jgi:pimeloyl-ACP methyl ester carboxylesterase